MSVSHTSPLMCMWAKNVVDMLRWLDASSEQLCQQGHLLLCTASSVMYACVCRSP